MKTDSDPFGRDEAQRATVSNAAPLPEPEAINHEDPTLKPVAGATPMTNAPRSITEPILPANTPTPAPMHGLADWLREREFNARVIADNKLATDVAAWAEDADYFKRAAEAIEAATAAPQGLPPLPAAEFAALPNAEFRRYVNLEDDEIQFKTCDGYSADQMREYALACLAARPATGLPPGYVAVPSDKYDDVLLPFLTLMRAELHANSRKGDRPGWLAMDGNTALLEVYWHAAKLSAAVKNNDGPAIMEHSADVANMAMMVLDICGGLALVDMVCTRSHPHEQMDAACEALTVTARESALASRPAVPAVEQVQLTDERIAEIARAHIHRDRSNDKPGAWPDSIAFARAIETELSGGKKE